MSSEIKADKWSPASGTSATIGDSGDTYTIPSGVTLANSGSVTGLPASSISSGVISPARLGTGTASSSTVLYGDGTFKAEPGGGLIHMATTEITSSTADVTFISGTGGVDFNSGTYENFLIIANGVVIEDDDDSFRVSVSIDAGSNYNAQLYMAQDTVEMTQSGSSASAGQVGQSSSGAIAMLDSVGNNLGNASEFHIWCYDFNSTTQKKYMQVEALMEQHNLIYKKRSSLINIAERTVAVDGIRFNCNSGTITKGKFRVYGISKG